MWRKEAVHGEKVARAARIWGAAGSGDRGMALCEVQKELSRV